MTGRARTVLQAILDAVLKLVPDVVDATASLKRDAAAFSCPEERPRKTVGPVAWRGITFEIAQDRDAQGRPLETVHCTIGVAGNHRDPLRARTRG